MNLRWKILAALAAVALFGGFLFWRSTGSEQRALEQTRRALRQQGFKLDLGEFDLSAPEDLRRRAAVLTGTAPARAAAPLLALRAGIDLMTAMGRDSAVVVWRQDELPGFSGAVPWASFGGASPGGDGRDGWQSLREALAESGAKLDDTSAALLAGPVKFNLSAGRGMATLLPHLAMIRQLAQTFGTRAVVELHDQNRAAAWTNALAATRLVTGWETEPIEISQMVRFMCATLAFNTAWQTLQAGGWEEERLARLQHEWETVDFFKDLPDSAAFSRASAAAAVQLVRQQPLRGGANFQSIVASPRVAWMAFRDYWRQLRYRRHGSYEDENDLLLYYRDREVAYRRMEQCASWLEICRIPGLTNAVPFRARNTSPAGTMIAMRQMSMGIQMGSMGLPAMAAEAEARRRVLVTAIALERYRVQHGSYPKTLAALAPDWLKEPPVDFADGQPLRYRTTEDGHFVLYSVGLGGVDDGGTMPPVPRGRAAGFAGLNLAGRSRLGAVAGADLIWPRPASVAEVNQRQAEEKHQNQLRLDEMEQQQERARAAEIDRLLAQSGSKLATWEGSDRGVPEPKYQGKPLSKVLRNEELSGTNVPTLGELLTVRPVVNGKEPESAAFEVPVRYDVATNLGSLALLVDGSFGEREEPQQLLRATNGNCLLVWNTTYDPPGRHAVQAEFDLAGNAREDIAVEGPAAEYVSSNLCQFDPQYGTFDKNGAILYAKLAEPDGTYRIELKSPDGDGIKTFAGSTTNGIVKLHWDLTDAQGRRYTNNSFDTVYTITLPGSGRAQTLNGP